jgi:hypothetical protein
MNEDKVKTALMYVYSEKPPMQQGIDRGIDKGVI